MNKIYSLIVMGIFTTLTNAASAQDLDLPKNIDLKYTVDYATYESYVSKCVNWLESTPLDQDKDKHSDAYSFLVRWVNGAPNVHVVVDGAFVNMKQKKNYPLVAIYMGEWSLYELKNGEKSSPEKAALQAIRAIIKVYKKGNGLAKDKSLEKLIELDAKGQLEKYVLEKLPKRK